MAIEKPRVLQQLEFERAAAAYSRRLPPKHFMETHAQSTQRKITLASFAVVELHRPDVHVFNEMLVQYRRKRTTRTFGIVPDNMAVLSEDDIIIDGSFDFPLQPCKPFWMFEYVSKSNQRKDYDKSFKVYERDLKTPYYLIFYPDNQELSLFRHGGRKYHTVRPNAQERYPVAELEIEVGLLEGWVRYWFRGELLHLPGDLQRLLTKATQELRQEREAREAVERENAELRAQLARLLEKKNGK